ncbi:jg18132 [Pararge aegeria aegeria]|uniref:Jg18132 protein n=1 Tax=Pararge aegeria aegeria TaxID=348720 RepID=A0A8S4S447_9NEOP|nr:jg18132 [Pararge aegeria aegeria]
MQGAHPATRPGQPVSETAGSGTSKAFVRSKETARMTSPRQLPHHSGPSRKSMVKRPALKPHCSTESPGPTVSRSPTSRSAMTFSKTFPISLSKTIGLYADGASSGRSSLQMRHSSSSFQELLPRLIGVKITLTK